MLQSTRLIRSYVAHPLPTNFTPTERFLRGSVRLWSRQVGDRRMKANIPLLGFLEFIARRSQERRTRSVDLGASGDGEEEPMMINAYRMLQGSRTVDVNPVTESVHLRPYFHHHGFYSRMMKAAAEWRVSEKVSVKRVMEEYFPDMPADDFVNLQSLVDEFIGMKDDYVFAINRNLEEDYTFLLRRVLWSSDEDGILLSEIEPKMRQLWNREHGNPRSGFKQAVPGDVTDPDNSNNTNTSNNNIPLPSLPFRCKNVLDVLNEGLSEWHFAVDEGNGQLRIFHFGWEAVLREIIRQMPVTGLPHFVFRRCVLAHHPCLAHSKKHGTWKSILDRLLQRQSEWVSVSVARTDNTTHIVRRLLPTDTHSRASSVTSEAVQILSMMESTNNNNPNKPKANSNEFYSFDDIFRCMSEDVKADIEGAESIYQMLKVSGYLEPDVRLFVKEDANRAATETIVLLDSSAIEGGIDNIPRVLLQANPQEAPHAKLICARKKNDPCFFDGSNAPSVVLDHQKGQNNNNNVKKNGEDVIAPAWMSNSVMLVAQLAKLLATRGGDNNNENNSSSEDEQGEGSQQNSITRRLKRVIVIVDDSEDKEELRKEIQGLVGDTVAVEFASPSLSSV